ncbi:SARP family transcriptional regulator [Pseudonocardia sp. C8]|uniref:AfsR/SARP family transcriptional regulator n=1 Tax=Pseudonocardia sp. C8 TaxID=2762759 RepID=UPI0016423861|nr:BTAD domain-containing putative transcriptional regulator [Pseudonocardia sp. C8]MBC3192827.1 SARP family transcriptional regulator [Pseudonocardia sp. C8]
MALAGTRPAAGEPAPPAGRIRLILVNGFRLVVEGVDVHPCVVCRRLLALLGLRGELPRAVASGTLWPDVPEARACGSLRTALWKLRRIDPGLVEIRGGHLGLGGEVHVDVTAVIHWARRLIERPTAGEAQLTPDGPHGDLLPGWYEDWVVDERERLRQLRLHALDIAATQLGVRGRYAEGITAALESIRLEPLRESAHHTLLVLHLAEGNVGEAVRHYRAFHALVRAELGVDPSPRLTDLITAHVDRLDHDGGRAGAPYRTPESNRIVTGVKRPSGTSTVNGSA